MACRSGHGQGSTDFPGGVRGAGRPRPSPLAGRKGAGHIWAAGGKIIEVPTPGGGAYLARFPGEGLEVRSSAQGLPKSCQFWRIGSAAPVPNRVMFKVGTGSQR